MTSCLTERYDVLVRALNGRIPARSGPWSRAWQDNIAGDATDLFALGREVCSAFRSADMEERSWVIPLVTPRQEHYFWQYLVDYLIQSMRSPDDAGVLRDALVVEVMREFFIHARDGAGRAWLDLSLWAHKAGMVDVQMYFDEAALLVPPQVEGGIQTGEQIRDQIRSAPAEGAKAWQRYAAWERSKADG